MLTNKINSHSILISILAIVTVCLNHFNINLFFFEEYEAYFTSMLSGKITPDVTYGHLYYFGQIGISAIYSQLYSVAHHFPWIPVFYEVLLVVAFYAFVKLITNNFNTFNSAFLTTF